MQEKHEIIYGRKPVLEALLSKSVSVEKIFMQKGLSAEVLSRIAREAFFQKIPLQHIPAEKIHSFTDETHQGVVALISPVSYFTLEELLNNIQSAKPLIVMLDGVTDVRNFGAIARTCVAFGVDGIIIGIKNSAQINSESIKTSAGNILKAKIARVMSLENTLEKLKNQNFQVVVSALYNAEKIEQIEFDTPTVLVIGSEEKGVSDAVLEKADRVCKIQMNGAESLNVSVATGVLLYALTKKD